MSKLTKKNSGVAAIEFVLLLPLLLLIGWISVDFGRLLFQYDALTKTTRDAARYLAAATRPPNTVYQTDPTYQATVTQATNLAICGSISTCTNTVVPGITASNIRIDYQDTPNLPNTDVLKINCVAGITCVRISIRNYRVSFITNDIAQLFGSPLIADNNVGISVNMRQIQQ